MTAARLSKVGTLRPEDDEGEPLVAYCALPSCRSEFRRNAGPGRRKDFCSEECRRAAEKDLRKLKSRLVHFENLVQQLRIDIAAFGRSSDDADAVERPEVATQRAAEALTRAQGVLLFAPNDDPLAAELRALVDAVAPLVPRAERRAS